MGYVLTSTLAYEPSQLEHILRKKSGSVKDSRTHGLYCMHLAVNLCNWPNGFETKAGRINYEYCTSYYWSYVYCRL